MKLFCVPLLAIGLLRLASVGSSAADRTWDGLGADDLWNSSLNWGGTVPVAGDALFFGGLTRLTPSNNLTADTSFAGITFNSGAGAFTLAGNRITLGGNVLNSSSNLQTINLNMILNAARSIDGGTAGIQIGGVLSGAGGLTTDGNVTINSTSTLTGVATVATGILQLGSGGTTGSIVNSSAIVIETGATLRISRSNGTTYSQPISGGGGLTVANTSAGILTLLGSAANTFTGTTEVTGGRLTLSKAGGVNAIGGDLMISGSGNAVNFALSGAQDQIADTASVTINGPGSILGLPAASFGVVAAGDPVTETIANLTVNDGMFNAGLGTWTITGAGAFDGSTGDSRFFLTSGGAVSFGSLSLTDMTGTSAATSPDSFVVNGNRVGIQTTLTVGAGGLILNGSRLVLNQGTSAGALGSRLVLDGNVTTVGTAASFIQLGTGSLGSSPVELSSSAGNHTRTFNIGGGGADLTITRDITNGAATNGSLGKEGAGTLTLSGNNAYTGDTTVAAGILAIGASERIPDTSNLNITGTGTFALGASRTETVGAVTLSAISGGITGTGNSTLIGTSYLIDSPSGATTISVSLGGSGALTKTGNSTLTLAGGTSNTYSGLTSIQGGQLTLSKTGGSTAIAGDLLITGTGTAVNFGATGAQNQIADTSSVTLNSTGGILGQTANNFGLVVGGNTVTETIANLTVTDGMFNAGTGTWTITNDGVFDGSSGDVRFFVTSSGRVNFGSLSLTGLTGTNAATSPDSFAINGNNATQSTVTVGAGGLALDGSRILLVRGVSAGSSGSRLVLDGDVTTSGTQASFIQVAGTGVLGTNPVELSSTSGTHARTFDIAGGGADLTVSVAVTNGAATTADLLKTGTGTLTLSGPVANTFNGLTTVNQGVLSLAKTGGVNAIGGDLTISGSGNVTFATTGVQDQIPNTAAVIVNGTGGTNGTTFNGTGANAPSGATNVTETIGSLSVLNGNFNTGAGSTWTVTGAGVFDGTGAADARFIGNSGSSISFGSLSLTAMTGTTIVNGADSFVLGGAQSTVTTVTVGSGGLSLNGSRLVLNQDNLSGGSRLVLNGDVSTSGSTRSFVQFGTATAGVATLQLSSTTGSHTRTFSTAAGGADLTVSVPITNGQATDASIIKDGPGILTLTGASTYTGTTEVAAGSLHVGSGGLGQTGTGEVTVSSGATLFGTGTVQGSSFIAESGSTVHAGDGVAQSDYGTLTFTPAAGSGSFDFQTGSNVFLGLNPTGVSDQLLFLGTGTNSLIFDSNLTIGPAAFTPTTTQVFQLLDWSGLASAPLFASHFTYTDLLFGNGDEAAGLNLPDISTSPYAWDISGFTTNGSIAIVVVPEPTRMLLMLIASASLLLRRRRIAR